MFAQVISIFSSICSACSNWFGILLDSMGATGFFLAVLFITMCVRYLLGPLFGAGSDRAKKKDPEGG